MKPDVVPEHLDASINFKILGIIIGAAIIFQVILLSIPESISKDYLIYVVSIINPLAASIASFIIAKRYWGTGVFGKAYTSLGFGYLMISFAEITYLIYEQFLELDPYPSIADVFFFAFYPLILIHLILNLKFFKTNFGMLDKILLSVISISIISTYVVLSFNELGETSFDFYYGTIFAIVSALTLAFACVGALTFREGAIGKAWFLLVIGILAATIGDIWYYYLEVFGGYSLVHPVNLFWYTSYWIVVYALMKHKNVI